MACFVGAAATPSYHREIPIIRIPLVEDIHCFCSTIPIGSMYGIYANIGAILMVNEMLPYIPYMDPMGYINLCLEWVKNHQPDDVFGSR